MRLLTNAAITYATIFTCLALVLVLAFHNGSPATCRVPDANGNKAMSLHEYNMRHAIRWTD